MLGLIAFTITFIVFVFLGYILSKRFSKPVTNIKVMILIIVSLLLFAVGNGIRIISIMGFDLMLNRVLGSLAIGYTLGIFYKMKKVKKKPLAAK